MTDTLAKRVQIEINADNSAVVLVDHSVDHENYDPAETTFSITLNIPVDKKLQEYLTSLPPEAFSSALFVDIPTPSCDTGLQDLTRASAASSFSKRFGWYCYYEAGREVCIP